MKPLIIVTLLLCCLVLAPFAACNLVVGGALMSLSSPSGVHR